MTTQPESTADVLADFPETSGGLIPQWVHDQMRRSLVESVARQERIAAALDRAAVEGVTVWPTR